MFDLAEVHALCKGPIEDLLGAIDKLIKNSKND